MCTGAHETLEVVNRVCNVALATWLLQGREANQSIRQVKGHRFLWLDVVGVSLRTLTAVTIACNTYPGVTRARPAES